jgi:hypothetical protein
VSKRNNDADALAALAEVANQYQVLAALSDEIRARRDFLAVGCYRRGIPLRQIAKAAGVHYTRIRQLTGAATDAAATNRLKLAKKGRMDPGGRPPRSPRPQVRDVIASTG